MPSTCVPVDRDRAAVSACWAALTLLLPRRNGAGGRVDDTSRAVGRGLGRPMFRSRPAGHAAHPCRHCCGEQRRRRARAEVAAQIISIATAVEEPDLLAFGRLTTAQAALVAGDIPQSMRLFDEVMVSVTMGDVSPIPSGIIYSAVVDGCVEACDLRRAAEWTEALRRWCDDQPDLVPYHGRSWSTGTGSAYAQGLWAEAAGEADRACGDGRTVRPALGLAHYRGASCFGSRRTGCRPDAYRNTSRYGHDPVPASRCCGWRRATSTARCTLPSGCSTSMASARRGPGCSAAAVEVRLATGDTTAGT